jgi:hypothetical protein
VDEKAKKTCAKVPNLRGRIKGKICRSPFAVPPRLEKAHLNTDSTKEAPAKPGLIIYLGRFSPFWYPPLPPFVIHLQHLLR